MRFPCFAVITAVLVSGCSSAPPTTPVNDAFAADMRQPEGPSGISTQPGWNGRKFAIASAHPLASAAGLAMLQAGGAAVDAAVAAQMVLTLVEPQSSGIGGGALLLHYDGRATVAFDGRETAPAAVSETLFIKPDGQPMHFHEAVVGGRAVGVPGTVRMLEMAHAEYGKLPWASLFEPAIRLAEDGFAVGQRLHTLLLADPHLRKDPQAAAYFYGRDGQPPAIGSTLRNPELADVLRRIAGDGSRALHEGEIAQAVVDKVQGHPDNPGTLSLADMAAYQPRRRSPICSRHTPRAVAPPRSYVICGFPPPASGAIAIAQILGILDHTEAPALAFSDPLWMHYYGEASRLAFADRAQYVADPDFVTAPGGDWQALISPAYLAERARLIGPRSMHLASPGTPSAQARSQAPMPEQVEHGTSHLSVVDGYGNALALTTTIEDAFGARQMVRGFLLNNELSDFSFIRPRWAWHADRQSRRARQTPALVDESDAGLRRADRRVGDERRLARRRADHPLYGQAALCDCVLGTGTATGDRPAQFRFVERPDTARGKALHRVVHRGTPGAWPCSQGNPDEQRPASHSERCRRLRRWRRSAA
jgi:gamma-glutamyltranspeptidase/glutathione hydrolase